MKLRCNNWVLGGPETDYRPKYHCVLNAGHDGKHESGNGSFWTDGEYIINDPVSLAEVIQKVEAVKAANPWDTFSQPMAHSGWRKACDDILKALRRI